jgi:hypothetical protein
MASLIDPTKPEDFVPSVKEDLRDSLQAAKDEIEALQNLLTLTAEERTTSHTYVVGDFPDDGRRPLVIVADPTGGDVTLTFPAPADFSLSSTEIRHVATILRHAAVNDVIIACANPALIRSQPGVDAWDPMASPLGVGFEGARSNATLTVLMDGVRGLMVVIGAVRDLTP